MLILRILFGVFLLCVASGGLIAQCDIAVDAGPDLLVCGPRTPVRLSGSVSADALGFEWLAAPSLMDSESLGPEADPAVTTTYTLVGYTADRDDNLVYNHDFELGNIGFESDYAFAPGEPDNPIADGGTYVIGDENQPTGDPFTRCLDHTGGGAAMYCNGSIMPNQRVWCQTVPIVPNQNYVLRAWVTAIWDVGAAELQFSVNGDVVGPIFFPDIENVCSWSLFDERWASTAGETSAEICIVNQTTIYYGYNFGIDDLFFAPVCEEYDEVTVTVVDTTLDLRDEYFLPCDLPAAGYAIEPVAASSGGNYRHRWTTDNGRIVSGADQPRVMVDRPGTYTLSVAYTQGGETCTNSRSVSVSTDPSTPVVVLTGDGDLSCNRLTTAISAAQSVVPGGSRYRWATESGAIVGPADAVEIEVAEPGTYTLTIDAPTGCSARGSINIGADTTAPTVAILNTDTITCANPLVRLDASPSVLSSVDSFAWSTVDGAIDSGGGGLQPIVSRPGTYTLTATNTSTGCSDLASMVVVRSVERAVARVEEPAPIDCLGGPIRLDGSNSVGEAGTTYLWTTTEGSIMGRDDRLTCLAGAEGEYQLRLTPPNGCADSVSVTVTREGFDPSITFSPTQLVTCDSARITLMASVVTSDSVDYGWSTVDGEILNGENSLRPVVDAAGVYVLTVTKRGLGCSVSSALTVSADQEAPAAVAAKSSDLNCVYDTIALISAGESSDPTLIRSWVGPDGLLPDTAAFEPGSYHLTVLNPANGCSAEDSILVALDTVAPPLSLSVSTAELTCAAPTTVISLDRPEPNLSYRWAGAPTVGLPDLDGSTISGALPGRYYLTVTDDTNGCEAATYADITANQAPPQINLEAPKRSLDCDVTEIRLVGSVEEPENFEVSWATTGNIINETDGLTPLVDRPGEYTMIVINPVTQCRADTSVEVLQNIRRPEVSIASTTALTCRDTEAVLISQVSEPRGDLNYAWTTSDGRLVDSVTLPNATVDAAGNYTLRVTDPTNGCSVEAITTVLADEDKPALELKPTETLTCKNTVRTLNEGAVANLDFQYVWTVENSQGDPPSIATDPELDVDQPGLYALAITDGNNGCISRGAVLVSLDDEAPMVELPPVEDLNCEATSRTLGAMVSKDNRLVLSEWSTTDGNFTTDLDRLNATVDAPGTYELKVTYAGNGCADSLSVVVGLDTLRPLATISQPEMLTCEHTNVTASLNPLAAGVYTYDWSTTDGVLEGVTEEAAISIEEPGTYTVSVRNASNQCSDTAGVTVIQDILSPVIQVLPASVLTCLNQEVPLVARLTAGRPGPTLEWRDAAGPIPEYADRSVLPVSVPGAYYLRAVDPLNGCYDEASWEVIEDRDNPVVELVSDVDLGCEDAPFAIEAMVAEPDRYTFRWSSDGGRFTPGGNNWEAIIDGPAVYTLRVDNPVNGCYTEASAVARRTLVDSFAYALVAPGCDRKFGAISFGEVSGGVAPYLYSIDDGRAFGTRTQFDRLAPGDYDLRVQDVRGCEAATSLTIDELRLLEINAPEAITISLGDSARINSSSNFLPSEIDTLFWSPAIGLSCAGCPDPIARPSRSTTYTVTVRTLDGCEALSRVQVIVDERIGVYFPTGFSPNGDGVNDVFAPLADKDRVVAVREMQIFDRWGNQVYEDGDLPADGSAGGWDGSLRGKPLNTGTYIYSASVEFIDGRVERFGGEVILMR